MTLSLGMVTVDTQDARDLARWWSEQVGGSIVADHDGWFVMVSLGEGAPLLGFQKVEEPTSGKNRLHLDLTCADRVTEVERLVAAGATKIEDRGTPEFAWTTLADPDGNEFCVSGSH